MLHIAYIPKSTPSGRGTTVSSSPTRKRPSVLFGLWCLTAVFASATADAETDGKCHRRQARRARQEPDALRFGREITAFPALAQQSLSTSAPTTLMRTLASLWDLWSVATAERNKSHSLALPARGRFERLFEKQKDFQVWRGESGQY